MTLERTLPNSVLGPVLRLALARLASSRCFELMEYFSYFNLSDAHVRAARMPFISRNSISPSRNAQPIVVVDNQKLFI